MDILVGYTGFVGSNIASKHHFDALLNSKNITEAFYSNPDLCVYAGVRAEKFFASADPAGDKAIIENAINNIKMIHPHQLVLISTIDVYPKPYYVNELDKIDNSNAHPYGAHRYDLEQWVKENIPNHLILRLPALFGKNLKKNFIYDLIYLVPSMLKADKYDQLIKIEPLIKQCYKEQKNGFYGCVASPTQKVQLKAYFEKLGFTALNFTDSRASYQFYNLSYLWSHIETALKKNISLINLAVEPLQVSKIYHAVKSGDFKNELGSNVANYDFRTLYAEEFGGHDGYIFHKEQVLQEIHNFYNKAVSRGVTENEIIDL